MRQLFLSFTFILIILPFAKSQTLTVKQVYDFQVNDVFIYSSTSFQNTNPPPSYYTHDEQIKISILERWESDSRLYYKREISTLDYYHLHTNSGSYPSSDKWDTTFTGN